MTLDEISVVFSADTAPFEEAVSRICALLSDAGSQADALASRFRQAGVRAGQGLADGLLAMKGQVSSAARSLADTASSTLESALDIHSPSRLTYQMGLRFDEGLSLGMTAGRKDAGTAAAALGTDAAAALEGALAAPRSLAALLAAPAQSALKAEDELRAAHFLTAPSALPDLAPAALQRRQSAPDASAAEAPLSITIPLEIDGYRLGVAAIEGINRVTHGTGRVELNL